MYKVFNLRSLIPPEMNAKNKEKTNKQTQTRTSMAKLKFIVYRTRTDEYYRKLID